MVTGYSARCWVCPGVRGQVTGITDWSPLAQESLGTCLEATGLHLARQQRFCFMMLSLRTNRAVRDGQTTRFTQTLVNSCHFIPKHQRGWRKSCQTLSLIIFFLKQTVQSNRLQNSIWSPANQPDWKTAVPWSHIITDHSCCGSRKVFSKGNPPQAFQCKCEQWVALLRGPAIKWRGSDLAFTPGHLGETSVTITSTEKAAIENGWWNGWTAENEWILQYGTN